MELLQEDTHAKPEATPDYQDTNTFHAYIQTIPDGYLAPTPTHTPHTPHIQPKDSKTSEKLQRNPE